MKNKIVFAFTIASLFFISCVQKTYKRSVKFSVDCSEIEDYNSISLRGQMDPLSWDKNYELSDEDQDSIFTAEIVFDTPFDYIEVKFVKNEDEFELKTCQIENYISTMNKSLRTRPSLIK